MINGKRNKRRPSGELAETVSEITTDGEPPRSGGGVISSTHDDASHRDFSDSEVSAYLRTDFLARIAHDLRSPLGVTSGAIQELQATLGPDLQKEHIALLTMAQRSLKKLARLADRLNMIAQLERTKLELARSPSDLVEVTRTALKQALAIDGRSAVTVRTELPETPCLVLADPRWLVPAFAEMVGNAVRHAHRSACVRVECDQDDVRLIVEDDGGGLTPDAREMMFRRLVPRQNDRSLGFGLSIARDVLAAHGGTLEVQAGELLPGGPRAPVTRFIAHLAKHALAISAVR